MTDWVSLHPPPRRVWHPFVALIRERNLITNNWGMSTNREFREEATL